MTTKTIIVTGCENPILSQEFAACMAEQQGIRRITSMRLEKTERTGKLWNITITGTSGNEPQ